MSRFVKSLLTILLYILLFFSFCRLVRATIVFSISNPTINSADEIEVDATISGLISSSCSVTGCYLQGQLQSAGGYFGYTYNNSGEYVDYFKNPVSTDDIKSKLFNFIPIQGGWNGKLKVKNNPDSPFYYGPGQYLLTFRRFSGNSLNPTSGDSNGLGINLTMPLPIPVPSDTPKDISSPLPNPTPFILKTASPTLLPTPTLTSVPTPMKTASPQPKFVLSSGIPTSAASSDEAVLGEVTKPVDSVVTVLDLTPSDFGEKLKKIPQVAYFFIILGIGLISVSIFSILKGTKKSYTLKSGKEDSQIS